jgi:hypothetical protein
MIRAWIAVALLAGSWMFGLDYFYPANPWVWAALAIGASGLLGGALIRLPGGRDSAIAIGLLIPALVFVPWPLKIISLLIVTGLAIHLLTGPHPNPLRAPTEGWSGEGTIVNDLPMDEGPLGKFVTWLSQGAVSAGVILAAQSLALAFYTAQTALSHELPWPLPDLFAGMANLLSIDAAADGSKIAMSSMRQVHRIGATWELLFDPATFCFFIGGLVLMAITAWQQVPKSRRWPAWIRGLRIFSLIIIAWLPVRAGLLIAIYMFRVLRAEPDRAFYVMNHFFAPWPLLILLAVPVFLVCRFLRIKDVKTPVKRADKMPEDNTSYYVQRYSPEDPTRQDAASTFAHYVAPIILIALAAFIFTAAIKWNPVGKQLAGRVKVVERHSEWEPTTRPYDTTWYGEISGYNYAAIYDYLGQYYEMSRLLESDKFDDQTLGQCDVLIIKTPMNARYSPEEVAAVLRFVEKGGGVLFIGDHTNLYRMATIMNDMTRPMGFIFRDDLLFSNEASAYDQHFDPPQAPHPSLQYMPPMEFAVSCSIDPGFSHGRAVITSTGLWSMPPDYHMENYHPIPQHCADMRYGAFVQVWAAWHGKGRAMAYTDSTIFSNFCTFQPGHAEIMLGMIEWLNHANPIIDPRPWLILLGIVPLCFGIVLAQRRSVAWLVLLAAGICGWVIATEAIAALHAWSMPMPKIVRPMTQVVIDRTTSDALLSKGAYTQCDGIGYGMMEQLIGRLGYRTIRQDGKDAFSGNALVVICPDRTVETSFQEELERYVANGGRLLVFDSPENDKSTANSLLLPFGLSIERKQSISGTLTLIDSWPGIEISSANEVVGGQTVGKLNDRPVAAVAKHGKGTVLAIGFSSLFIDKLMGGEEQWMVVPDTPMLLRYETLYALVHLLVEDKPIVPVQAAGENPTGQSQSPFKGRSKTGLPLRLPEVPLKELGPQE